MQSSKCIDDELYLELLCIIDGITDNPNGTAACVKQNTEHDTKPQSEEYITQCKIGNISYFDINGIYISQIPDALSIACEYDHLELIKHIQ